MRRHFLTPNKPDAVNPAIAPRFQVEHHRRGVTDPNRSATLRAFPMPTWSQLPEDDYQEVWDRFYDAFAFRPSVYSESWPGIREPVPSLTYSFAGAYTGDQAVFSAFQADLHGAGLSAFRLVTSGTDFLYALDWQHTSYRFYPHIDFAAHDPEAWAVPILPDGDYSIFLAPDFSFGVFGHPWEQSICIFGEPLLRAFAPFRSQPFSRLIRRDGQTL
jgi:hypothetical protein